jgi:hypothetical protein
VYSSLGKIDVVTQDPIQYIQTDHRTREEIEAEPELSVLFALTRILKAHVYAKAQGVEATVVYAALEDDTPAFLRETIAAANGIYERASDRHREPTPSSSSLAELADAAFRGLADRVVRRTGLSEPALALRSLEAELAIESPSEDDDELAYWTAVLELAAVTGEVLRAKLGGRWEESTMADIPFGFATEQGSIFATNRAQRFLADGEGESMFLLLGDEALAGDRDLGAGLVMPSLRSREDALRENMAFQALHTNLAEVHGVPVVAYGIDHPQTFAITIASPEVDLDALHVQAMQNLAAEEVEVEHVEVDSLTMLAISGSFYAAEKLLDRAFMRRLHAKLGADTLAAAVPRRGLLFVAAADPSDPSNIALLGAAAQAESKTTRAISDVMLVVSDGEVIGHVQIEKAPDDDEGEDDTRA